MEDVEFSTVLHELGEYSHPNHERFLDAQLQLLHRPHLRIDELQLLRSAGDNTGRLLAFTGSLGLGNPQNGLFRMRIHCSSSLLLASES